jgi:ATP phosphoribosyltransferase regulatory subunit
MSSRTRWLLPAGIEEVLPENAAILEFYRRKLLDLYATWGYQLVLPPFIEFIDSLLIGDSEDLNLQTFKLTDQLSGRTLGVRADMTPQVARIDAHMLKDAGPTRLCYCGTVLLTRPEVAGGTRSPLQIGAELYGHDGIKSDVEIIELMLATLKQCGANELLLDLGHAGIYSALIANLGCDTAEKDELFALIQRKAIPDIETLLKQINCDAQIKQALTALVDLHGGKEVLDLAKQQLKVGGEPVMKCIDYIEQLGNALLHHQPSVKIHYDLADLRGYHYQNDIAYAAYDIESGEELARGGRYNNIGKVFGRARPATGFSADLKKLIWANDTNDIEPGKKIFAPAHQDQDLTSTIQDLRTQGEIVIRSLTSDSDEATQLGCTHQLQKENNKWIIQDL